METETHQERILSGVGFSFYNHKETVVFFSQSWANGMCPTAGWHSTPHRGRTCFSLPTLPFQLSLISDIPASEMGSKGKVTMTSESVTEKCNVPEKLFPKAVEVHSACQFSAWRVS